MTTGAYRRVDLMLSPALPTSRTRAWGRRSSRSRRTGTSAADAWPRILLLVASTSPLRVDNWWSSSLAINQQLFGQRHWTDVQTDEGIDALVQLVRPLDPSAEVAIDRVDAIVAAAVRDDDGWRTTRTASRSATAAPTPAIRSISPAPPARRDTASRCARCRAGSSGVDATSAVDRDDRGRPRRRPQQPQQRAPRPRRPFPDRRVISDPAEIQRMVDEARASRAGTPAVHAGPNSSCLAGTLGRVDPDGGAIPRLPLVAEVAPATRPPASPSAREWKNAADVGAGHTEAGDRRVRRRPARPSRPGRPLQR